LRAIGATPMSNDPAVTTLFGPRKSAAEGETTPGNGPSAVSVWKNFLRFAGRALVFFSMLFFLLSGYLAFAHYWILTRWAKSEATVLSREFRQISSGSTSRSRSVGTSSKSYYYHCTVSYPVAGETRQSQLDSPPSTYKIDAEVWGAPLARGQRVAIMYRPSDPSDIRLVDNPAEATASGSLRLALYLFVPGMLLILTSRSERLNSQS